MPQKSLKRSLFGTPEETTYGEFFDGLGKVKTEKLLQMDRRSAAAVEGLEHLLARVESLEDRIRCVEDTDLSTPKPAAPKSKPGPSSGRKTKRAS